MNDLEVPVEAGHRYRVQLVDIGARFEPFLRDLGEIAESLNTFARQLRRLVARPPRREVRAARTRLRRQRAALREWHIGASDWEHALRHGWKLNGARRAAYRARQRRR